MSKETKAKRRHLLIWIVCLVVPLLLVAGFLVFGRTAGQPDAQATTAPTGPDPTPNIVETAPAGTAQTLPPTTAQALVPTTVPVEQPQILTDLLTGEDLTVEALSQRGCTQLICVTAQGTTANIRFFTCREGLWEELSHLNCEGFVGASGIRADKQEGDGATPTGLYPVREAFYIGELPQTGLDTFEITQNTYWVDDPDSQFYNRRVEDTDNRDWSSAEHMIDYPVYRCGFAVGYNETCEYRAGSAIFFHIGSHPTAGCIATTESMVRSYLSRLDKAENPYILITTG